MGENTNDEIPVEQIMETHSSYAKMHEAHLMPPNSHNLKKDESTCQERQHQEKEKTVQEEIIDGHHYDASKHTFYP